jgi:hypothetical protein
MSPLALWHSITTTVATKARHTDLPLRNGAANCTSRDLSYCVFAITSQSERTTNPWRARSEYNSGNGGVLVWFLELLWRAKPRPSEHYTYARYMPAVPDTVLLNFSRIQQWYFTPRHRHIGGGRGGPAAAGAHGAAASASGTQASPLSEATPANGTSASTAGAAAAVGTATGTVRCRTATSAASVASRCRRTRPPRAVVDVTTRRKPGTRHSCGA